MLTAIECFVRIFERLLIETPEHIPETRWHADNDNHEAGDDERRWAAFR